MKAIGIVRAIDNLGRIVIPKELRKSYNINVSDPFEFFVGENNEIVLKPYFNKVDIFKNDIINQLAKSKNLDSKKAIDIINLAYENIIKNSDFKKIEN